MKFKIEQVFDAPLAKVIEAREKRYELLPNIRKPDYLERKEDGGLVRSKRKFIVAVPDGMSKIVPPDAVSFVDISVWDAAKGEHRWNIISDKFPRQITWQGATRYTEFDDGGAKKTRRVMEGEVKVKIPFVGDQFEKMISSGFKKNFEKDHATIVEALGKF